MFKLAITNNLHFTILIELTIIMFLLVLLSAMDWHIPFVKLARESVDTPCYFMLNHFTPKISLVILLTVCHIHVVCFFFFGMLVWRICYWIN